MKKLKFNDVYNQLEKNQLTPYNFYNIDLGTDQILAVDHYLRNEYDSIEITQKLKKVFLDIEVYLENQEGITISQMVNEGRHLVNAVSQYYSSTNTFWCYFVPPKGCQISEQEFEDFLNEESCKAVKIGENEDGSDKMGTYFNEGQKVKVKLFNDGVELVKDLWRRIKEDDPAVISGKHNPIQI